MFYNFLHVSTYWFLSHRILNQDLEGFVRNISLIQLNWSDAFLQWQNYVIYIHFYFQHYVFSPFQQQIEFSGTKTPKCFLQAQLPC